MAASHKTGGCLLALTFVIVGSLGCDLPSASPQAARTSKNRIQFQTHYRVAAGLAAAEQRPLLVLFTCRDCPCCRYMLQHVLSNPLAAQSADPFVCVHIELEKNPELCGEFRVQSFPTMQFVSSDGVALRRVAGQMAAEEMVALLENVRESEARRILARTARPARYTIGNQNGLLR